MNDGSDLAKTDLCSLPSIANVAPPTGPAGSSSFTYPKIGNVGSIGLNHAGLNSVANVGS